MMMETNCAIHCLSSVTGGALSRRVDKTLSFQMAILGETNFFLNIVGIAYFLFSGLSVKLRNPE